MNRFILTSVTIAAMLTGTAVAQQGGGRGGPAPGAGERARDVERRADVMRERALQEAAAPRGRIGVTLGQVSEALAAQLGLDADQVVLIEGVFPGGAADEAGVKAYDIITRIDGESPVTQRSLREAVLAAEPGEKLRLTVLRAGDEREIDVPVQVMDGVEARALVQRAREEQELHLRRAETAIEAEMLARRLSEAMRRRGLVEEELRHIELWREGDRGVRMFVPPDRPGERGQPPAMIRRENLELHQQRMERIEQRLERIEKMLEQLLEASR